MAALALTAVGIRVLAISKRCLGLCKECSEGTGVVNISVRTKREYGKS